MLSLQIESPEELAQRVAARARAARLAANLSQAGLAARAGVSTSSLKRFERTGEIAFVSLLRIAHVLEASAEFEALFPKLSVEFKSLDEIVAPKPGRRRGRIR